MPNYPQLDVIQQSQVQTDVFRGYNHNLKISDGECYDMLNMSTRHYPLLSTRPPRSNAATLANPRGILAKDALTYVNGSSLFYNGEDLTSYLTANGVALNSTEKTMVSMGAYIVIWPDKVYINTENYSDCGYMEASFSKSLSVSSIATYSLCKQDGSDYENLIVSDTEPSSPSNGQYWLDTSGSSSVLKCYSTTSSMWIDVGTVYTRIECAGIGERFEKLDGVEISGIAGSGATAEQLESLNSTKLIYDKGTDYITVVGIINSTWNQTSGTLTVSRNVPALNYVCEAQNRLWGCFYGIRNGETVNELYCCALGDFKNWEKYQGVSTDSWRASCGTDGVWTGAIAWGGYPMFFKENYVHKIYVSSEGAHQVVEAQCRGVQRGSSKSLCVVNETLYYLSRSGVCAFTGSVPASASPQFGDEIYSAGVAGYSGERYYLSAMDSSGNYDMLVYDAGKGLWCKEDGFNALGFARVADSLYCIDADTGILWDLNGVIGSQESSVSWSVTSGRQGLEYPQRKYVSRLNLKLMLAAGATMAVHFQYDSDGTWRSQGNITGSGDRTFMLPIRPRRCDHYFVRLSGTGEMKLFSFAKILETGSDYE